MSNKNIKTALFKIQGELGPTINKDAANTYYNSSYVSFPNLLKKVHPVLSKHNVLLTQKVEYEEGNTFITTELHHLESGESELSKTRVYLKSEDSQQLGSGVTYTRRIALTTLLGLAADDDDDGEAAVGRGGGKSSKATKPAKFKPSEESTKPEQSGW